MLQFHNKDFVACYNCCHGRSTRSHNPKCPLWKEGGRRGGGGREGREGGKEGGKGGRKGGREGGIIAPNSCEGVHVVNECYQYVLKLISCRDSVCVHCVLLGHNQIMLEHNRAAES